MTSLIFSSIRPLLILLIFIFSSTSPLLGQGNEELSTRTDTQKMQWFEDAKLGIFIHWGIYAVNGIDESWSFYNGHISHEEYMEQLNGFTAKNYRPSYWAKLIKQSGARYAV
ncbi:MAG TPA: alpha-L-fucosidase, partial [Fodinibius sp.]|nr:alpha-L-fucosidase [Fodinibius sp.]